MVDTFWHTIPMDEVIRDLGTNADTGLSLVEIEDRLRKYGYNQLEEKEGVSQYCSARCLIVRMHGNSTPTSPHEGNPFRVFLFARLPPFKNASQNIYLFLLPLLCKKIGENFY